ncbi:hypothetical protein DBR42_22440 [Pelomonas sp. HMWF004]|nr:hypothetical protein DBR42_22440 [Pelomonas sp. HMWF004]
MIRADAGVVLTKVTLWGNNAPVNVAYTVTSKRTPEVPNFDVLVSAETYFEDEVARSKGVSN